MHRDGESITRVEAFGTRDKRVGRASQIEIERAMVKVNVPLGSTGLLPSSINDRRLTRRKGPSRLQPRVFTTQPRCTALLVLRQRAREENSEARRVDEKRRVAKEGAEEKERGGRCAR